MRKRGMRGGSRRGNKRIIRGHLVDSLKTACLGDVSGKRTKVEKNTVGEERTWLCRGTGEQIVTPRFFLSLKCKVCSVKG